MVPSITTEFSLTPWTGLSYYEPWNSATYISQLGYLGGPVLYHIISFGVVVQGNVGRFDAQKPRRESAMEKLFVDATTGLGYVQIPLNKWTQMTKPKRS